MGEKQVTRMKYLVVGAGGTGGMISAYMSKAGMDITLIARGSHLHEIKYHGLNVKPTWTDNYNVRVRACEMNEYQERPDVVFICVKDYQLEGVIPFLRTVCDKDTIAIPVLNGFGVADRLAIQLPSARVISGLIYISANKQAPGTIKMHGEIFRIFFGTKDGRTDDERLCQIEEDLLASGIDGVYSNQIDMEILKKFSYVSPWAACGIQFNVNAGEIQKPGFEYSGLF